MGPWEHKENRNETRCEDAYLRCWLSTLNFLARRKRPAPHLTARHLRSACTGSCSRIPLRAALKSFCPGDMGKSCPLGGSQQRHRGMLTRRGNKGTQWMSKRHFEVSGPFGNSEEPLCCPGWGAAGGIHKKFPCAFSPHHLVPGGSHS